MKMKKMLSAVCALAMSVSVFANVAFADTLKTGTYDIAAQNRITVTKDAETSISTVTTANNAGNQYALAIADFSNIADDANTVEIEFDSTIGKSRWMIGLGNANARGTNAASSSRSTYNKDGLMLYFGTSDGNYYRINGGTDIGGSAFEQNVHTKISFDKVAGTYSYDMSVDGESISSATNIKTNITKATILEIYSWAGNATMTISPITVKATIPDVIKYTKTIKTAPYAKVTVDAESVYTDHNGLVSIEDTEGTEKAITVSKNGYENTTVNVVFDSDSNIDIPLTPSEENVLFYEDFANTGITNGFYGTATAGGGSGNPLWSRLQSGAVEFIGGGSGYRSATIPFTYATAAADIYTLTFDVSAYLSGNPETSTTTTTISDINNNVLSTIAYTTTDSGSVSGITINDETVNNVNVGDVTIEVNTITGSVTTTTSGTSSTITVNNAVSPAKLVVNLARRHRYSIDNIKITTASAPAVSATVNDVEYATGDDDSRSAYATVTVDGAAKAVTYTATTSENREAKGVWDVPTAIEINGTLTAGVIVNGLNAGETVTITAEAE